jgi:nucleotide-binding universal stress UspA family protein
MTQAAPRIVVGVDGSGASILALRWAAHFSALIGASIDVVGAWDYPLTFGQAAIPPAWNPREDMVQILTHAVDEVFGANRPAGLQTVAREGNAARTLLETSDAATMLIVGSRGHGGFEGLLLGSVSANVAEHATCPVLIIHGSQLPPEAMS